MKKANIDGLVPGYTYFLIRNEDDKIVGMINIRSPLNEELKRSGGNIGYGIRPTERGKGYNKINLYLGLEKCLELGLDEVLLDAAVENPASWRTMEALGGERISEYEDGKHGKCYKYTINVSSSLDKYKDTYENKKSVR